MLAEAIARPIRLLQYLSIDVGLAALASATFASYALQVQPRPIYYLVLFLAVIGIYNADHAWDASRVQAAPSIDNGDSRQDRSPIDQRRAFHKRWHLLLIVLSVCAFLGAGIFSYQLRHEVILAGIMVGVLMFVYFLLLRSGWLLRSKEIFVSVGFTAGIWIPQLPIGNPDFRIVGLVLLFFVACVLNLLGLALCDMDVDRRRGDTNLALNTSQRLVRRTVVVFCLVGCLLSVAIAVQSPDLAIALAALQIVIQGSLCFLPARWNTQIRLLGDWGFVLFGLPWLFQKLGLLQLIN